MGVFHGQRRRAADAIAAFRSVLRSADLSECVAETPADYINIALALAHDLPRLAGLREGLRDRLQASSLMDEIGLTRELEDGFRAVWQAWCETGAT
jgi:predicted O-linked N-acetylglucosamine transferase (SPINDLY family)